MSTTYEPSAYFTDHGAIAAAPFTLRPPSPPHLLVGPNQDRGLTLQLLDSSRFTNEGISEAEFSNVFQMHHTAKDIMPTWTYEKRRQAQMIIPSVYLGPSSAAKDREFLKREGITLLLVVRDTRSAVARLISGDKVAAELGIKSATVDIDGSQDLIAKFPEAIRLINDHLLSVYREQITTHPSPHHLNSSQERASIPGKVLVFCESGTDRSACVVAAYLMAMYNVTFVYAIQFIQSQRFCIALDAEKKGLLQAFQDIIDARVAVGCSLGLRSAQAQPSPSLSVPAKSNKRGIEDTMDVAMDEDNDASYRLIEETDRDRFEGRAAFAPYIDR